jgi:hypothetical protein
MGTNNIKASPVSHYHQGKGVPVLKHYVMKAYGGVDV